MDSKRTRTDVKFANVTSALQFYVMFFCPNGHKIDKNGCEICECNECPPVLCDMACDNGFKTDENGCEICECNECAKGVPFVQCFAQPCSFQETECKEAASCSDDYCGGCNAHYFDAAGNEICKKCPDIMCALFCANGYETNENGCEMCKCKLESD